nr:uncharacterized protein LOC101149821 isoform X1 [Gorilla gorilla gorilla]
MSRFPVPPTSPCWCLHLLPSILQCLLLWAWPQGYGRTPVPSQRPLVIVPWHMGRGPAGSAEELRMEAAEEALMGPTIPDPSLLPGGPLVSFLVWAEAITWMPTWEGTSNVGPQPLSNSKSHRSPESLPHRAVVRAEASTATGTPCTYSHGTGWTQRLWTRGLPLSRDPPSD